MKKFISILLSTVLLLSLIVGCFSFTASAASASMSGSISGSTATFYMTVTDGGGVGGFEGDFSISGGSITSVSGGDMSGINGGHFNVVMQNAASSVTLTITCSVSGDSVSLSSSNITVINDNADVVGTCSASATATKPVATTAAPKVTTTAAPVSQEANLASLSVEGYAISPEFNAWTTEYSINVPASVSSVKVAAEALKGDANVTVEGTEFTAGEVATVKITVAGSDGTVKVYNITVNPIDKACLSVLTAFNDYGIKFDPATLEYSITVPQGVNSISVNALAEQFPDAKVEVVGADDLKANDNTVTITVTDSLGQATVYTIKVAHEGAVEQEEQSKISGLAIALMVVIAVVAFAGGFFAHVQLAKKAKAVPKPEVVEEPVVVPEVEETKEVVEEKVEVKEVEEAPVEEKPKAEKKPVTKKPAQKKSTTKNSSTTKKKTTPKKENKE